jgi:uncharacterized membrane protein
MDYSDDECLYEWTDGQRQAIEENIVNTSIKGFLLVFLAAILAVVFDYVLEPVAINLNYWQWAYNIIPLQNYLAWFLISFGLSFIVYNKVVKLKTSRFNRTDYLVHF